VVLWSPETAEHDPDYRELGRTHKSNLIATRCPICADSGPNPYRSETTLSATT
jgi:hypothetical protein